MITTTYIRDNFKVENAFEDAVIQRHIDFVESVFTKYFGTIEETTEHFEVYRTACAELVFSRLLSESVVLTGFGVVHKKDEYSERPGEDELLFSARSHVDTATTMLMNITTSPRKVRQCVEDAQFVVEGFFRHTCNYL